MKRHFATIAALIAITVAVPASAQPDLGLKGAGIKLGLVGPEGVNTVVGFGVFTDLGNIAPNFMLESTMDYWSKSGTEFGTDTSVRDLAFGGRGKFMFAVPNPRFRPYAGLGLALHFVKTEIDVPARNVGGTILPAQNMRDADTRIGLDIGGGILLNMNERAEFLGELWFGAVQDVNQVAFRVGVLYKLGR